MSEEFIVTPAVYPRLIAITILANLKSQNQAKNIFRGSLEFPNQNLRQLGHVMIGHTYIQKKRTYRVYNFL